MSELLIIHYSLLITHKIKSYDKKLSQDRLAEFDKK